MKKYLFCLAILVAGCKSIYGNNTEPNPDNCVDNGGVCPEGKKCDTVRQECRPVNDQGNFACATSTDCTNPNSPVCINNECAPCTANTQCVARGDAAICNAQGMCRDCNTNTMCENSSRGPICDIPTNTCRTCTSHLECDGGQGICVLDESMIHPSTQVKVGQCVPKASITIMDNSSNTKCMNGSAICDLSTALSKNTPYIRVLGSTNPYTMTGAIAQSVFLVGPGLKDQDATVTVEATLAGAITITSSSTILVDGLRFRSNNAPMITCNDSTSVLKVQRSAFDGGLMHSGLLSNACKQLTVNRSQFSGNGKSALEVVQSGSLSVTNSLFFANAGFGNVEPTVKLGDSLTDANTVFAFNTLIENGGLNSKTSAVSCSKNPVLRDSIIIRNVQDGAGTQFAGNCQFDRVFTDMSETSNKSGLIKGMLSMAAQMSPYKLTEADTSCVDQGQPLMGVSTDYFGTVRPQGTAPDLGYFELVK